MEGEATGGGGSINSAVKTSESHNLQMGLRRGRHPESRNVQNYRSQVTNFSHMAATRVGFFHPSDGPSSKQTNKKLEEVVLESLLTVTVGLWAWKPG